MICDNEAMAEKQPRLVLSIICQLQKKDKDSSKRCFSPAVDTVSHLKVGVVAVHSLSVASFASEN